MTRTPYPSMEPTAPFPAVAVLLLSSSVPVLGQDATPLAAPPEYAVQQWTTEDGLPQNSVNAIAQGPDGQLWLGTFGGLVRFDGSRFTLVERTDSGGSHLDRVLSLAIDRDGALWIGTEDALLRREAGAYQVYTTADGLPDDEVTALHVDADGALWIGTARGGVARLEDDRFSTVTEVDGRPVGRVEGIVGDSGTVWVNAADRFITVKHGTPSAAGWSEVPAAGVIHRVLRDRGGASWFSLHGGLARETGGSVEVFGPHEGVPEPSAMVEDPVEGYWLGTRNDGLFRFRPDGPGPMVRRYALPDGRLQFRVRTALVDFGGNVWIGTNANGLLRVKRKVFTTYSSEHGLSHDVVTALFQSSDGTHWVGTNCGGVNALDLERRSVRVLNPRSPGDPEGDPCIFALAETPSGAVWQGTWGGGVSLLAGDPGAGPTHVTGLPDSVILSLHADWSDTLWVGTNSGGLAAVEQGRVRAVYTTADGLAHNSVRTVFRASGGDLWIGTLAGLSRVRNGRLDTPPAATPLASVHVRAIHQDSAGDLWVGTYGAGLYRLRGDTATAITRHDGLAEDVVSALLEDDRGGFWMSGNRGIQRVARSELVSLTEGDVDHVHAVLYGVADGLRNAETNGGFQPAALKDEAGRLWFPTLEGVAVVDPGRILTAERPPTVTIDEVVVDGEPRSPDALTALGPDRPNLEFRYTGLSLSAPEHVTFRYRLDGFDQAWVEAGSRRVAYYPRLEPGTYRFVVSAANRDGVWSQAEASLPVRVNPPFWSAWWFRLWVAFWLLAIGAEIVRRRQNALRRDREAKEEFSRRLIESQEHERKRLAGELHDGLGQSLLIVRNRALLALQAQGDAGRITDQLRQITDVVADSLRSVRELAHNLTPHELDHLGLSAALRAMTDAVAETTDITLAATIEDINGLLPIDEEINVYRIVQEALSNVVRHSDAATASVTIRRTGSAIQVSIVDDGRGFARDSRGRGPESSFGLSGMAERARILGGLLEISSEPGKGTRIDLAVPVRAEPREAAEPAVRGGAA